MKFKENNFYRNGFSDIMNMHLDLFYCFLRLLQAKICKFPDFGGHLGKMQIEKNAQHLVSGSKRIWIQQLKT